MAPMLIAPTTDALVGQSSGGARDRLAVPAAEPATDRMHYLDGLRGYAALIVVLHHAFLVYVPALYTGQQADSRFGWDVWLSGQPILLLFFAGNFAVCLFFVLSGFVLAHVYSRTDASPLELVVRRYVRLCTPILASTLIILALGVAAMAIPPLQAYLPSIPGALDRQFTLSNILGASYEAVAESLVVAPFFGISVPTFNGVLWTMRVEFMGSFLLIGLFWLARRLAPAHAPLLAALFCVAGVVVLWASCLGLFLAGCIFHYLFGRRRVHPSVIAEVFGAALIVVAVWLGTMPESGMRPDLANRLILISGIDMPAIAANTIFNWAPFQFMPLMVWHAAGAVILLPGLFLSSLARRFLSNRVSLLLGLVSFPVYLLQIPAKSLFADPARDYLTAIGAPPLLTLMVAILLAAAGTIAVAYPFARVVETRAIAWSYAAGAFVRRLPPAGSIVARWSVARIWLAGRTT